MLGTVVTAQEKAMNDRAMGGLQVNNAEFNLRYLPENDEVEFIVTLKDDSWLGLALGSQGMSAGSDMITFGKYPGGAMNFAYADNVSVGYQPPEKDMSEDLMPHPNNVIEQNADGRSTIFVRRRLDTGDPQDFAIPLDQEFFIGYAYNGQTDAISYYTKHEVASSVSLKLPSSGEPAWGELKVADPVSNVSVFDAIIETFNAIWSDNAVKLTQGAMIASLTMLTTNF